MTPQANASPIDSTRRATALVTGATAGIGFHTAAALARAGMQILITGRDEARGRRAVSELRRRAGHDAIDLIVADALSIRENRRLADEVGRRVSRVDVLINNVGGGGFGERRETPEGLEATLALNFAGPFALTTRFLALYGHQPNRIINVVSSAFAMWKRDPLEDLDSRGRYVGIEAIAHAKLLNLLFALALARRLGSSVFVAAVNPGMAWTPGVAALTRQAVPHWRFIWPLVRWMQQRASAESAARSTVTLATAKVPGTSGRYFDGGKEKRLAAHLHDTELQDRVWAVGESLVARAGAPSSTG
jgi:NAD(P)-dependent dehydrogenase (short-subunit alcohol dehydrogenase family)